MTVKTKPFDVAAYLQTPEDIAAYLQAVVDEGDAKLLTAAMGDVARAVGMTDIAREAEVSRPALYKALSESGDPRLSTLVGVCRALGIKLSFEAA